MDAIYAQGRASASDVRGAMPDAPSDSAVRTMLRGLEEKGHLEHTKEGRKFVFSPVIEAETASRSALRKLVQTFFSGSIEAAMASLIDIDSKQLSKAELDRLSLLIRNAKKTGGRS